MRVQYKYGSQIVQVFTGKGSQLAAMLGKKTNYWSRNLEGMMKVFNNAALA